MRPVMGADQALLAPHVVPEPESPLCGRTTNADRTLEDRTERESVFCDSERERPEAEVVRRLTARERLIAVFPRAAQGLPSELHGERWHDHPIRRRCTGRISDRAAQLELPAGVVAVGIDVARLAGEEVADACERARLKAGSL